MPPSISGLMLVVLGVVLYGSLQLPQLLQEVLGYTATDAGLAQGAIGWRHRRGPVMSARALVFLVAGIMVTACAVGPHYKQP
ncbi:MAG: hypothetical protein ACRETD_01005, partial [Steroidobacteraceae bacterium]